MHKSYQSTLPSSSKILQKKWDDKYYSNHRVLIRDARPSVDTRPPRTFMHMHMKLKKLQLEEERTATIERDNRILLEKMSHIMQTTGRVDNRNEYAAKSLNQEKRRRELLRVSKENATLAKRLVECKPENRDNWKNGWSKTNSHLDNISRYTTDWHLAKPNSRQGTNGKPTVKRSESAPGDDKKDVKPPATTPTETETQQ